MPQPVAEPPPTPEELKRTLPELFGVAAQCSTYHMAFSLIYPSESASGALVMHRGVLLQMFNTISEANLMCIRKSAEFFKPRAPGDRADTLHSYQYPGYTNQVWIVPREVYIEFHKRVGHLTLQQVRNHNMNWPVFELAMQALNQWVNFLGEMAVSYAAEPSIGAYCARCADVLRNHVVKIEREALQARRNADAAAREVVAQDQPGAPPPDPNGPAVTGAVILIGSLLWEGEMAKADGAKGMLRKKWRDERLEPKSIENLRVPIRYARVSESRASQYTMAFGGKLGTAKLARLKRGLPVVTLAARLKEEADALAFAEGIRNVDNPRNCAKWGLIAIAINPQSPLKDDLRTAWASQFEPARNFNPVDFGDRIVDKGGFLLTNLAWGRGALVGIDFCLATPTAPNDPKVTAAKIAKATKAGTYFARTRKSGIKTAQDDAIVRSL